MMRRTYESGKRAFDAGDYGAARDAFTQLDEWLADTHVAASDPGLGDLRTLAQGFLDLSVARAARPALVATAAPTAPRPTARPSVATTGSVGTPAVPPPFTPLDFLVYDASRESRIANFCFRLTL